MLDDNIKTRNVTLDLYNCYNMGDVEGEGAPDPSASLGHTTTKSERAEPNREDLSAYNLPTLYRKTSKGSLT